MAYSIVGIVTTGSKAKSASTRNIAAVFFSILISNWGFITP